MILSAAQIVAVTLIGGLVALDGTSVGQFMLSRPFVAAALGGLAVGRPAQGIVAGIVLEALHLAVLPVGAARYPEGGPPAVAAGAIYAANFPPVAASSTLLVAVLVALGLEMIGGRTVVWQRHWNERFAATPGEEITPGALAARQAVPIAADFARGAAVTLSGVLVLAWLMRAIDFSGFPEIAVGTIVRASVVAGLASALRLFGRAHYPLFLAGAVAGIVVAWLR